MSNEQLRRLELLERRLLDLERELRQSKYSTPTIRNYTEVAICRHLTGDTGAPPIGAIDVDGVQTLTPGTATLLEVLGADLKPIDNAARDNPAKIEYLNLTTIAPSTNEKSPFLLLRTRTGVWVRATGLLCDNPLVDVFFDGSMFKKQWCDTTVDDIVDTGTNCPTPPGP